jgi:phosphate-selective porin
MVRSTRTVPAVFLFLSLASVAPVAFAQAEGESPVPPPSPAPPPAPAALSSELTPAPGPALAGGSGAAPQVPIASTPVPNPPPSATPVPADAPLAGYRNGSFFVRSTDDVFRLYVMARVHADWIDQFGPGTSSLPSGSGINDGFFIRRARMELAGEFYQTWQWQVSAEFSSATAIDNATATQQQPICTPNNTTGALPCTNTTTPVESATVKPIPTDVFVNYGQFWFANVEVGQYYLPFTLENRISDNTTPFLERAVAVRNIGAPLQRDIGAMLWGETRDRVFYYAVALLNGDGPNRVNIDSRYEVAGRLVVRPFAATTSSPTKWAQIGFSARQQSADPAKVGYDLPSMTTQDGFAFWKPTYKDSYNRLIHIIPSTGQWGLAGDVYVPIDKFDLTGEFIYVNDSTREAVDGYQLSNFTERLGTLKGYGWYAQAGYWILGDHDIIGYPSYGRPIHVDLSQPQRPAQQGVQVLAKFEQLRMNYDGSARGGTSDAKTPNGTILVDDFELGINYWATRHLRVGFNYTFYAFPNSEPVSPTSPGGPVQTSVQRAIAPAQLVAKGQDDAARDGGHVLHELSARVGVQF